MDKREGMRKKSMWQQLGLCLALIAFTEAVCLFFSEWVGYRIVAFILLMIVSLIAAVFDRWPVFISAAVSAFTWNFFFIPPQFTLHIASNEDFFLLLMYFVISLLNIVITSKIREIDKKKQEKAEQERSIVLYNTILQTLSHELRTPIATIIGSVDTLNELNSRLTAEQREALHSNIHISALRLNDQVLKLLSMSRLEAGALPFQADWCDINELIFSLLEKNRGVFENRTFRFEASEGLPLFRLDEGLIETALFNLLQNAVKYTPAGSSVIIRAYTEDEMLCIAVSDEGPGFPEESLHIIFDKFARLPDSGPGGTGLGLSIVKGFTEAHNGTVTLSNLPEGGACFVMRIPAESSYINALKHE